MTIRTGMCVVAVAGLLAVSLTMIGCASTPSPEGGHSAGAHPGATFANTRCPMMGSDKVSHKHTREFKGDKVAFCCPGCPEKWDKLPEAEKTAKLAKAK